MPRPVTTTLLIGTFCSGGGGCGAGLRQRGGGIGEQANTQPLGFIDDIAIHLHDAVGDAQHQLAHDHALEVDDSR